MRRAAALALLFWSCAAQRGLPEGGSLMLDCEPKDAEVAIDGVPRGACADFGHGRAIRLGEGMHRVEVKKAGYAPYSTYCEPGGTRAALRASLEPVDTKESP